MEELIAALPSGELRHIVRKCLDAKATDSYGVLSTGERVTAAVVLNRFDWLEELNYTMAEAFDRIGPEWWPLLRDAERFICDNTDETS